MELYWFNKERGVWPAGFICGVSGTPPGEPPYLLGMCMGETGINLG